MKKFLWALIIGIAVGVGLWFFTTKINHPQKQLNANQRLKEQTGNFLIPDNLPFIYELIDSSSGELKTKIHESINMIGLLSTTYEKCTDTQTSKINSVYSKGSHCVYYKNNPIVSKQKIGSLGSGLKKIIQEDPTFLDKLQKILSASGNVEIETYGEYFGEVWGRFKADPKTFEVINDTYTKDKYSIYVWGEKLNFGFGSADVDTFVVVGSGFSKDNGHIYYYNKNAYVDGDPSSFVLLNSIYAKDNKFVYLTMNGYRLEGADTSTFEIINNSISFTAKDKKNIYSNERIISGIDPTSLQIISNRYSKDKNNIYFLWNAISGVDVSTFQLFSSGDITAKDKNNYYVNGMLWQDYILESQGDQVYPIEDNYDPEANSSGIQLPDFIISTLTVNTNNQVRIADETITLHVTIWNAGKTSAMITKDTPLRINCSATNSFNSYIFNISKDITSINGGKEFKSQKSFSLDVQTPVKGLEIGQLPGGRGNCFLYNEKIQEIDGNNNGASINFVVNE